MVFVMKTISDDIIGREEEIRDLRMILEHTSIVMSSTRRMGKTMILTKMHETDHPGSKSLLCFFESVQSAEEFVNKLHDALVEQELVMEGDFKKFLAWLNGTLGKKDLGFLKTPDFKRHWKVALNLMMDDLVEKHVDQVVIMMDEFPKMIWNLIQKGNQQEAGEILDELRSIRERLEKRSKLRFIYCGSVGMNLVIGHLIKQFRYTGAPLNNMHHYIVHEMTLSDATELVAYLMGKRGINSDNGMISYLAEACSCLPFFIDRILIQLKLSVNDRTINQADIDRTMDAFISGRDKNNQFNHFTERIEAYYDANDQRIAHQILRVLCKSNEAIQSDKLLDLVKLQTKSDDFEILKILSDLYEDMYIDREAAGDDVCYRFRYVLLKKWWRLNRA